jgi:hypothetical protein
MGGAQFPISEREFSATLPGSGRSDSISCETIFARSSAITCADVTIIVEYVVLGQEAMQQHKEFRFATRKEGDLFRWYEVSLGEQGSVCLTAALEDHSNHLSH